MSDSMSCTTKPREHDDYDNLCRSDGAGGYSKADGSTAYSSGKTSASPKAASAPAASAAAPTSSAGKTAPPATTRSAPKAHPAAVASLVKSQAPSISARTALVERRTANGYQVQLGVVEANVSKRQVSAEASVAKARIPISQHSAVKAELGTVKAHGGLENPDGSRGVSVSAGASAGSVAWEYESGAESMSVAFGAGLEASMSIGVRDQNGNGIPETCWSAGAEVTVGACVEDAAPQQNDGPANGAEGAGSTDRKSDNGSGGASGF